MKALTFAHFAFLTGTWIAETPTGVFEEVWLAPLENSIQGTAREITHKKSTFMEFFSVEEVGERFMLYILLGNASKGPKTPKAFELTMAKKDYARFENPENDFPSVIVYERKGKKMEVTLTGKTKTEVLHFTLAKP